MKSCEDAIALVCRLRLEGVSFFCDMQSNIFILPAEFLTPDDQELIRAHKPAVVAWLRKYAAEMYPSDAIIALWRQIIPEQSSKNGTGAPGSSCNQRKPI